MRICFIAPELGTKSGWGRYANDVVACARSSGHHVRTVSVGNGMLAMGLAFLRGLWAARGCDVVYGIDGWPFGVLAWAISRVYGSHLILGAIGTYTIAPFNRPGIRPWMLRAYRDADMTIAISRYTRDRLLEKVPEAKVAVVTPGILFEQWRSERRETGQPQLISVGGLKPRKGYLAALEAFAIARQRIPTLTWAIVASPEHDAYANRFRRRAQELGVADVIHLYEQVSDDELRRLYAVSRVFILLSENQNGRFEGFGIVFLEAAAAGLPVIGTRDNGIEDAVGGNGVLVKQGDARAAAQAIVDLINDESRWESKSQASREWAAAHDRAAMCAAHERVYRSISGRT